MKLPIKKKYFDKIKSGEKRLEFRDAHITFVCEETGEQLRKDVNRIRLIPLNQVPSEIKDINGLFEDSIIIEFDLTTEEQMMKEENDKVESIKEYDDYITRKRNILHISLG